jgi:UDP-galactopyranose mutase
MPLPPAAAGRGVQADETGWPAEVAARCIDTADAGPPQLGERPLGRSGDAPASGPWLRCRAVSDRYDTLVVGAGFAGSIMAERLTAELGRRVLVVDRRDHTAGNAYDYTDEHGVLVHRYGPHIFHTNAQLVVDYLSRFTAWRPYEHRVLARVGEQLLPIPINRTTINELYGLDLRTEEEVEAFYAARREPVALMRTSEDAVVAKVGRDLYEKFFRGYTRKQWERDPSELHASVCARIPVRTNDDDRYFGDAFQQMPRDGYTKIFERMLDGIEVRTGTTYEEVKDEIEYDHLVYTGPIDAFFDYRFGELPYRSLEFELRNEPTPGGGLLQPAGSINEPSIDVPWTRTTEYRHMTGQVHESSSYHVEYPRAEGDPYYPIPRDDTRALYKQYEALAAALPHVTFVGRLARYQYLNMDQVVAQALATYGKLAERLQAA